VYKCRTRRLPADSETSKEAPHDQYELLGLDIHKKTISYCVKDAAGAVLAEGMSGRTACRMGDTEAIPFYKRAIELNPNFAWAYAR
jgi:hypothetical protein